MAQDLTVVLYEPDIPHNTGAIARLCVATCSRLCLVGRLGFQLDDRRVRRAGLDYWEHCQLSHLADWSTVEQTWPTRPAFFFSAHASKSYTAVEFPGDALLVFGSEERGLPPRFLGGPNCLKIPIWDERVRSLNLATAVGIVLYEAIRQQHELKRGGRNPVC